MKRKVFILFILFLMCKENVLALTYGGCEYSTISRLKSLVSNINLSYDYRNVDDIIYFDVTLTNIPNNVYFEDSLTDKIYTYSNTQNGEITISNYTGDSGRYIFYLNIEGCDNFNLGSKYYSFPVYNNYYEDPICLDIPDYSLCKKWIKKLYTYDDFKKMVYKYKMSLEENEETVEEIVYEKNLLGKIIDFYIKYYYLLLIGVIAICWVVIFINRRKNKFKL